MTTFFVRTDRSTAGPLTGVELREAALAGILTHDAVVGGSPRGPWFPVSDVGLFSEKKTPLPHPPGTHVPRYQVRGMPGAFRGPFKLRELIGFAARGMLPPDALLQSDTSDEWLQVRRYRVLSAVLSGELVLIDESGKMVVRSAPSAARPESAGELTTARAPIELVRSADMSHATSLAPAIAAEPSTSDDPLSTPPAINPMEQRETTAADRGRLLAQLRASVPRLNVSIPPRLAIQLVCVMLIFVGVASAFSYWKKIGVQRADVIGDWMARNESGESRFGISLQLDGRCIIFNANERSWSGDFVWEPRQYDTGGLSGVDSFSSTIAEIHPHHETAMIEPTDGYVRLQGFVKQPPLLDGQPVRELFLRRVGRDMQIGYLASLHWSAEAKRMEAGWITATRDSQIRPDIAADLRMIGREVPIPTEDFGGEIPMHISDAVDAVRAGAVIEVENQETTVQQTLAYSIKVNAAYMLQHYGLPDEARRIFRFEIPSLRNGPSFEAAQVVRYDELQFILSQRGQLLHVAWVDPLDRQQ